MLRKTNNINIKSIETELRKSLILEIAVLSSIIAIALFYYFYHPLSGVPGAETSGIIKALGLSLVFLNFPYCTYLFYRSKSVSFVANWYRSEAFITISIIFVVILIGFLLKDRDCYFDWLFPIIGFGLIIFILFKYLHANVISKKVKKIALLAAWLLFSLFVIGSTGISNHTGPLYTKKILFGSAGIDPLFHASIAHMIQTYGVPSTGIDGLPYIPYHWGTHWIFSQLSNLLQVSPFYFYELCYPVIFIPLFFSSIFLLVQEISRLYRFVPDSVFKLHTFLIFAGTFISFLPLKISQQTGVGGDAVFISHSFNVSLTVCFLFFSMAIHFWKKFDDKWDISYIDRSFLYVLIPLLMGSLGLLKISTLVIAFSVITYLFIRLGCYKSNDLIASYLLAAIICVIVSYFVLPKTSDTFLSPLHYIKTYTADPWKAFHSVIYYFWSFLFLGLAIRIKRISSFNLLRRGFSSRATIDMELILVACIVGFLPGALISIPGGSAGYFAQIQRWVSLIFLIALLNRYEFNLSPLSILAFLFLMPVIYTIYNNGKIQLNQYRKHISTLKNREIDPGSRKYQMLKILRKLDEIPLSTKRKLLLYIPKSNGAYWNLSFGDTKYRCKYVPFIAPALSGIAMIDGLPERNCDAKYYGYKYYGDGNGNFGNGDLENNSLCDRASKMGFEYIIRIDEFSKGLRQTQIVCESSEAKRLK